MTESDGHHDPSDGSGHPTSTGRSDATPHGTQFAAVAGDGVASEPPPMPPVPPMPAVIGIGASAGGLEAFTRLVNGLRPGTGLAYVLVTHLDPVHESLLPEILARTAPVPVSAAVDGVLIEADHVYVIPPGAAMTVADGHLRIVQRERARGVHTVIDGFLESLSQVHGSEAVGVILSGAGSDGSQGIEAIKERGGITLAQDPGSAQFPSMPDAAIATGCIDFVLPPEGIAEQLLKIGRLSATSAHRDTSAIAEATDHDDVERILGLLRTRTATDFRHYRDGTVQRRILRRMLAQRSENHGEYLAAVRANPAELDLLHGDILIGVTRFFRDPEAFAALKADGFPQLMEERSPDAPIRVWVAGCSGGEEAYSVAMSLLEYLTQAGSDAEIQIFATDLNVAAITRARAALYPHSIEDDVSAERLSRFFVREEGGYRVRRSVRDLCVFATHNLVQDPPFSQLDLITCRNVLIYFDEILQDRATKVFHYGLRNNGVLMLGAAESVPSALFSPLDKPHRIFRRQPGAHHRLDLLDRAGLAYPISRTPGLEPGRPLERSTTHTVQQDADRAVVECMAPGIVINEQLEITQFRGDTTGFLQHAPGVASLHLLKLVRPEFLPRLRAAVERATHNAGAIREANIALRDGDSVRHVSIDVIPFRSGPARDRFFVILFDDSSSAELRLPAPDRAAKHGSRSSTAASAVARGVAEGVNQPPSQGAAREIAELREELVEAKRYLQDVIEQYEAANEELRAASEEIQSSNEELQSTNEELETTKEEVQSTNEELTTVNEELRHRNREMAAISSDLANVFSSTQIPVLIVDSALTIRRFTPVTASVMKVIGTDIGRPLSDIKLRVDLPDLEDRVARTIQQLELSQADVMDDQGRWWALTIRPYLTVDRKVDGAVLVFTDIDAAKKYGEQAHASLTERTKLLAETELARAEASAANLAKFAFLANISHDLRTPLNAISGYTDLMELGVHGPLTPAQEADLARIKRNARHLLSLINDILNFAKVERGQLDLNIVSVPISDALAALTDMTSPQLRAKGLRFDVVGCDGAVLADREKLQQVLLNLVTNATKFTVAGGIAVRCSHVGPVVQIQVRDTGPGIPADQRERIFEPFIQVGRSLTDVKHEGVGLGLSISRDLTRAMGGDITVESTIGRGSTFTVTLPRSAE